MSVFEHRQRDLTVPIEISLVYRWFQTINFSLHCSIKNFKNNDCLLTIVIFFLVNGSFLERFLEKLIFKFLFTCQRVQRRIRMFISFSEILVMRNVG